MNTYISRQIKLEGGPYDGGIDVIDNSECKGGGKYVKLYQKEPLIYIVYGFGCWIVKDKTALFRFSCYDYAKGDLNASKGGEKVS